MTLREKIYRQKLQDSADAWKEYDQARERLNYDFAKGLLDRDEFNNELAIWRNKAVIKSVAASNAYAEWKNKTQERNLVLAE